MGSEVSPKVRCKLLVKTNILLIASIPVNRARGFFALRKVRVCRRPESSHFC